MLRYQATVKPTVNLHKTVVGAPFYDVPIGQNHNLIGIANGGQAVSDDDAGATAATQIFVNLLLRGRIKRTGPLIHDEDARVGSQSTGNLESLALPAAHVDAVLRELAVIPPGARHNDVVDAGILGRLHNVLIRYVFIPHAEVVPDTALEQHDILINESH